MANTVSSKKNIRIIERRTALNKARRSRIKTFLRKVLEAVQIKDEVLARKEFVIFESEVMKGVTKGVYKKNTAARKLRRVAQHIRNIKTI